MASSSDRKHLVLISRIEVNGLWVIIMSRNNFYVPMLSVGKVGLQLKYLH